MSRMSRYVPPLLLCSVLLVAMAGGADDQDTPMGPRWWPSPWGADDQRGAANRITPAKVLEASRLIQSGRMYQLGRVYEQGMPLYGARHFSLTIPGSPTYPPAGKNQVVAFDELVSAEIGQVGTQFDGLGHIGVRIGEDDYFYNGFRRSQFATPYGLQKLGVENVGPIFTRGVLLDVARQRNTARLPGGYVITAGDLEGCLAAARLEIRPGDAVLIHTGHGQLWMKDNDAYNASAPGLGIEAARWLSERQIVLVGADTSGIEAAPGEDPDLFIPVHAWNIARHGIYHLENLDLGELAAERAYEFAFIFSPLRLKGATGSPGNPIAVR